MLQNVSVG